MELTGLGGGIMLAIAAALWLVYLVPNWLKRREYLATERNAVRLQQTIRVLAETAEIPDAVRREAAARRLAELPVAVGRPVTLPLPRRADPHALAVRRLRRTRAVTGLAFLASLGVLGVQAVVMVTGGVAAGSFTLVGGASLVGFTAFALLGRLAEVARGRTGAPPQAVARRTSLDPVAAPTARRGSAWVPVPVPQPLYLSRSRVESGAVRAGAAGVAYELAAAAASAEEGLRAAQQQVPTIADQSPEASARLAPAMPSRFAGMGIVDAATTAPPDLDAMLARRRVAG